jgi:ribosomal protein S18 acetylase RimI-like enzyme
MPQIGTERRASRYPFALQVTLEELTASTPEATLVEARALLLEYGRFILSHREVAGFCFGSLEKEAERLPASYIEREGGCLIARVDGNAAGFVAWRAIENNAWEMKRLWVRPEARGLGLGRALTQAVLDRAAAAGRTAVYLDTVPEAMAGAHRLYMAMGFVPCAAYNDNPVHGLAFLVKFL